MRNITIFALAPLLALTACGKDEPEFLRSSENIQTQDLRTYISAETHTHVDAVSEPGETHTTLVVEYYGYDNEGYFYNVALSKNDKLSVTVGGETTDIPGKRFPTEGEILDVEYLADIDTTAPGSELLVHLNRASDADIHTTSVVLHEETPISALPASLSNVSLSDEIILEWTENEDFDYKVVLALYCQTVDDVSLTGYRHIPNPIEPTLSSPLTIVPADYFSLPSDVDLASCELHSSLFSDYYPSIADNSPFKSVIIRTSRENAVTHTIAIE